MRKRILPILAIFVATASAGLFAACGDGENGDSEPHVHELVFHEFKDWNCTEDGNNPYYSCKGCDACFADESMTTEYTADYFLQPATGHSYYNGICSVGSCGAKDPNYVNGGFTQAQMEYAFTPSNYENLRVDYSSKYTNATIEFSVINGRDVAYVEMVDDGEEAAMFIIYDKETEELKTYNVVYENEGFDGEIADCVLDETATDTPVGFVEEFFEKSSAILNHYYTMEHDEEYGRHTYYIEKYKDWGNTYVSLKIHMNTTEEPSLYKVERYNTGTLSSTAYYSFYDEPQFELPLMIDPDHVHDYAWGEVLEDATCTEEGLEKGTCECGKTDTRPIGSTGHSYSEEWTADKTYHWHEAICGCKDAGVGSKGEHAFVNDECACGKKAYTEGLSYTYDDDAKTCTVSGIGTATGETEIVIPSKIDGYAVTAIGTEAFSNCTAIAQIYIPDSITLINGQAFKDCTGLTGVTIPNSVTSIEYCIFSGCYNLTELTLPLYSSLATLFDYYATSGMYKVLGSDSNYHYVPEKLVSVTVTGGEICTYAFYGISRLTEIQIAFEAASIGLYAFQGCSALTELNIPESVTSIGGGAFEDCSALTEIIIPDAVTTLDAYTFSGCSSLERITIPFVGKSKDTTKDEMLFGYIFGKSSYEGGVATEQKYFQNGSPYYVTYYLPAKLTSVTVTGGDIANYAFYNCVNLTNVKIEDGVGAIGSYAFMDCDGLTYAIVCNGVEEYSYFPFIDCDKVSAIYYEGTATEWEAMSFGTEEDKTDSRVYYYSAEPQEAGSGYWHYDTDGETPVSW